MECEAARSAITLQLTSLFRRLRHRSRSHRTSSARWTCKEAQHSAKRPMPSRWRCASVRDGGQRIDIATKKLTTSLSLPLSLRSAQNKQTQQRHHNGQRSAQEPCAARRRPRGHERRIDRIPRKCVQSGNAHCLLAHYNHREWDISARDFIVMVSLCARIALPPARRHDRFHTRCARVFPAHPARSLNRSRP